MANLKAMDSDWFAQTYMGRKSKVNVLLKKVRICHYPFTYCNPHEIPERWVLPRWRSSITGEALCPWVIPSVPPVADWLPRSHTGCRKKGDSMDLWQHVLPEDWLVIFQKRNIFFLNSPDTRLFFRVTPW